MCRYKAFLGIILLFTDAVPALAFPPPAEPQVRPIIAAAYSNDLNLNKIDDALETRAATARARLKAAVTPQQTVETQALLAEFVDVELVFSKQITQKQIDDFLSGSGQIDYIYKSVSYGFNGRIPLGLIEALPSIMGTMLVLVQEAKPVELYLDLATRTGRVRPVWAPGFAGNPAGFDGSGTITIAIVDTGIDAGHSDLAGRQVYWRDFSSDGYGSPVDVIQHGSHVSGIAFGTGASGGSATGTLFYTDAGNLAGVPSGSFYPFTIGLPAASVTWSSTAQWAGAGSTTLYQVYHTKGVSGGWTAFSSAAGGSPLTLSYTFTGSTARAYSTALLSNGSMQQFVITNSVTNYPGVGDGFNRLSGVAPGCNWAAAKVFTNSGSAYSTWISAAVDDLVANRIADNIKVMNLSLGVDGNPGIDTALRQKINTAVNNGIVVVVAAGNDGTRAAPPQREIDDPGRAGLALTVAAANDEDQLTDYTSHGFTTIGSGEDYKPDIMAPGGSTAYYTEILSVDSGSADGSAFADQQADDYTVMQGTSMASPFAAGAAALVIDALQQQGLLWDFASSQHALYVKMLLCATASETNANREGGNYNPTIQRASAGPDGFPAGKDRYEGYGILNPDAAVEAASLVYTLGSSANETLGPGAADRRVWARKMALSEGLAVAATLTVPSGGDFDLYLYSDTPGATGTPAILASSTQAGNDVDEAINYAPPADANALLVVKKVSGSGTFVLNSQPPPMKTLTISSTDGGDVAEPGEGQFQYDPETVVDLIAVPDIGYHFVNWTGDTNDIADVNSAITTITMFDDYSLVANFAIDQLTITASAGANGSIDPSGVIVRDYGSSQLFTATPDTGYEVDKWQVDGNDVQTGGSTYTLSNITANHSVYVSFAAACPAVTASAGPNGGLDPQGDVVVCDATSRLFTATPDTGYDVDMWYLDGDEAQIGGYTLTLENITDDHTIYVTFKEITFAIRGLVVEIDGVTPVAGVLIADDYNDVNAITDAGGYYELWVNYGWDGNVWPQKDGFTFEPNLLTYTDVTQDYNDVNFTATLQTFEISGSVADSNGVPIPDAGVCAADGGGQWTSRYGGGCDATDANGFYTVIVDYNWSGNVVPAKYAHVFEPNRIYYNNVLESVSDQNYAGLLMTFAVSGYVKNECNNIPVRGVLVDADNGGSEDITDVNGFYEVWVDYDWSGTVAATKNSYTFEPQSIPYTNVLNNYYDQNYVTNSIYDLDCDGLIGLSDLDVIAESWLTAGPQGDFDADGIVDFLDFAEFGLAWPNEKDTD